MRAYPVDQGAEKRQASSPKVQFVGDRARQANLFEKIARIIGERRPRQDLSGEADAGNFCTTQFEACKAVPIGCPNREFFLKVVCVDNSRKGLFHINVCR